jgi:hypothetical protein
MAGLDPAIHVLLAGVKKDVDARDEPEHDESKQSRSSLRANGSRECAPDDRLREAIHCTA